MDARQFYETVKLMRENQIGFFKSAKGTAERNAYYQESKRIEKLIDDEIARVESIMKNR